VLGDTTHTECEDVEKNKKTTYTSEFVVLTVVNTKFMVNWNAPLCCSVDKFQGLRTAYFPIIKLSEYYSKTMVPNPTTKVQGVIFQKTLINWVNSIHFPTVRFSMPYVIAQSMTPNSYLTHFLRTEGRKGKCKFKVKLSSLHTMHWLSRCMQCVKNRSDVRDV